MDLAAKRGVFPGAPDPGPAEGTVAACFASRKQIRISASADLLLPPHGLARQGAGRIEPAERYTASPRSGVSE